MSGVNLLTDRQDVVGELAVTIQHQQVWGGKKIKKESSKAYLLGGLSLYVI
ncbi:MAG: hypothetical protein ACN6PD_08755 [Sphingobacterium sp.]